MLNSRTIFDTCPLTGERISFLTEYPDPTKSLNDVISKSDLCCGQDCNYEPCPLVEHHNQIY